MQKLAALLLLCSALHGVVWTTAQHSLNVDLNKVLFTVNRQFLSVCIDAYDLTNPHDPQWSPAVFPARAINMAKALSPAMLRVGGTSGDHLVFNNASLKGNAQMSPEQWDALNEFAINVGWDFVFGLNVLLRQGVTNSSAGTWDPSNAKQLIEYTESKGYKVNWELGNGIHAIYIQHCSMFYIALMFVCLLLLCCRCVNGPSDVCISFCDVYTIFRT